MKFTKVIAAAMFFCIFSTSYAAHQNGEFKVSSLRTGNDGVYVQFNPAPSACNSGAHYRMHARVRHSVSNNYNALVSTLLTAHTTGQTFKWIWHSALPEGVDACSDTAGEILELNMVEFTVK